MNLLFIKKMEVDLETINEWVQRFQKEWQFQYIVFASKKILHEKIEIYLLRTASQTMHIRILHVDLKDQHLTSTYIYIVIDFLQISYRQSIPLFMMNTFEEMFGVLKHENLLIFGDVKHEKSLIAFIWQALMQNKYLYVDSTLHTMNCNQRQIPKIVFNDIVCPNCNASIDIQWKKNVALNYLNMSNIWNMWKLDFIQNFFQWFPEEVLLNIFEKNM
jgi:hypothetical protein